MREQSDMQKKRSSGLPEKNPIQSAVVNSGLDKKAGIYLHIICY
jgi:hypothetical protein